ncbi:MAG: rod shape-determining protein [Candidatus Binatia bacterium]
MIEDSRDIIYVGIDLGTSRSSISASNGERHVVDSYVGWPVDVDARELIKKPVLVGRDALDNRPLLDLRRPLEHGIMKEESEKDQDAVQELVRHLISLVKTEQKGKKTKVRAVVGVPAEAFRANRHNLRSTMARIADSVMMVSQPFAVAYGLEALLHALVIDIGAETADFCVMQGRYPTEEDQKTLPNAGDSIDEQLMKLIRERHPDAQFSIHMIREWKEQHSFVGEPKNRVIVTVPIMGKAAEIDITQEMRSACESILAPICETLTGLLMKVEPEYRGKMRNNVIVAGGTSLVSGLPEAITRTLKDTGGGRATAVIDPVFTGSDGSLAIARDASASDWDKLSL